MTSDAVKRHVSLVPRHAARPPAGRRLVLGAALAVLAAGATLAGCGFHRRVPQALNYQRIALSGFADRSTMAEELRRALPAGVHVVANVNDSQVVIQAIEDTRKSTVEASTAFGQVRVVELHVKLRYRVLRPDGTELLPLADLERFRDMSYDEKDALAKDTELDTLYRDLQSDMAIQLVRVLAAVGNTTGPAAQIGASLAASAAVGSAASAPVYVPAASGSWGAAPASVAASAPASAPAN